MAPQMADACQIIRRPCSPSWRGGCTLWTLLITSITCGFYYSAGRNFWVSGEGSARWCMYCDKVGHRKRSLQTSALNKRTARIACVCPPVQDIYFSYGSVTFNIVTTNHHQSDLPHLLKSSLCLINFDIIITSWAEITQSIYWLGWMTEKSWFNSRKEQKISLLQTL